MKKYGLFNNLRWYLTYLRKDEPSLAWTATGLAIDKAAAALLGVFTPALLVGAIVQHATLGEFAWLAGLTGLGLAITSEVDYLLMTHDNVKSTKLRTVIEMDFHQKQWDLDYDQISSGKVQGLAHTAFSKGLSWTYAGAEAIYIYGRGTLIDIATLLVFLATFKKIMLTGTDSAASKLISPAMPMRLKTVRIFGCLGWPVGITPILIDSSHFKMLGNAATHCGIS